MLTVKHIMVGGKESVRTVTKVDYYPQGAPGNGYDSPVVFTEAPDGTATYEFGRIYVMNENGKTVASYHLGGSQELVVVNAA